MAAELIGTLSRWVIPLMLLAVPIYAHFKGVQVFDAFTQGARESLTLAGAIFPYLLGMLVAINILRASGFLDFLAVILEPITKPLGVPGEVLPMALLRPVSGSGALGVLTTILKEHGPDSMIGRIASTMQGSTETTFYVLAVYFGSVGITKYRHAIWAGLIADIAALLAAVYLCGLVFS